MKIFILFLLIIATLFFQPTHAQDTSNIATKEDIAEIKGAFDGMNETVTEMKNTLDILKKIKISGYIQAQYQIADTEALSSTALNTYPIGNFAGGSFPTYVNSRFQLRRGRLKINYDNDVTQYVLQLDLTQNGVGIKDAYISVKEEWYRTATLTAGIFDRPFGYEISHSSNMRESPERSRMFQTLFPGERELGAKIELVSENERYNWLNLKAGFFNGVLNNANENDSRKDFIGRIGFLFPFYEENFEIDCGVSLYAGNVRSNSTEVYSTINDATKKFTRDSLSSNIGKYFKRNHLGADIQMYYDIPSLGGFSLRGEFITGTQPGTASSNSFYNPGSVVSPLYERKFYGWYINFVQNFGLSNQLLLKYDVFDPNSKISDEHIGATGSNLKAGDIKYSTFGLGWIYHWDANVKFIFFKDFVTNEKVNNTATGSLIPFKKDVKDNVLSLRMQYKF
ncbi:MAG: porin [Bacteroidota bacterium]